MTESRISVAGAKDKGVRVREGCGQPPVPTLPRSRGGSERDAPRGLGTRCSPREAGWEPACQLHLSSRPGVTSVTVAYSAGSNLALRRLVAVRGAGPGRGAVLLPDQLAELAILYLARFDVPQLPQSGGGSGSVGSNGCEGHCSLALKTSLYFCHLCPVLNADLAATSRARAQAQTLHPPYHGVAPVRFQSYLLLSSWDLILVLWIYDGVTQVEAVEVTIDWVFVPEASVDGGPVSTS
ncbi:hypothetical protein O3P69_016609 [Scylla paramamosain]|uniref:Uncharacterized protein n=1 Tax=Scylla paramamosain TaxID=85552 RepID=A0AAW0SYD8_SCYPA